MEIVHVMVGERRRLMTGNTLGLSVKEILAFGFEWRGFRAVQPSGHGIKFRRRWKIDHVLHLRHVGDRYPINDVHAFLHGPYGIAVEVGRALLEFRKIFHRADGTLGTVDLLVEHASQTGGI